MHIETQGPGVSSTEQPGAPTLANRIELPNVVTEAQRQAYIDDGFLVLPRLLAKAAIDELIEDTYRIVKGAYPSAALQTLPPEVSDAEALNRLLCIHMPHSISPVVERYMRHPLICGALAQLAGAHLPHWDGSVKCMQSMLFVKPPGFQGQAWHQDEIYIPTRDRSLTGAWIAIDDATTENGCLWVIPGSHRTGYLYPQRPHGRPDEWDTSPESYGFDERSSIPVEVPSGSLVFFNGYLLHRSFRNRSDRHRRVLVNHYMNAWSKLPWYQPKNHTGAIADIDIRSVVPVAGVDPYAWRGQRKPLDVFIRMCEASAQAEAKLEGRS